ncbi:endoglucanase A precursor [Umbelopsis sp. AD052]|nr:endoglucanase A precursor [Umbelopsis sp. AD052]
MKSLALFMSAASLLAATVTAAPLEKRAAMCGQWDSVVDGSYTIYQDLWGEGAATSGSQCTTVNSLSGSTLSWSTSWSWAGASSSVKSFANAALNFTPKQLSAIKSIPITWKWSYTGSNIVADVAFDMFTSSSATGSSQYEIMIWLAALGGAGPISSTGSPIYTFTNAGVTWNLYSGPNGSTTVYSFVASSTVNSLSTDVLAFFTFLESKSLISSSQYLTNVQAGTEPFTGSNAVLSVSAYSAVVN